MAGPIKTEREARLSPSITNSFLLTVRRSQLGKLERSKKDKSSRLEKPAGFEESINAPSPPTSKRKEMSAPGNQNAPVLGPRHFSEAAPTLPQEPQGLTMVSDHANPIVDIIFIHGLGGSPMRTWCWGDDLKNFWPAWLCHDDCLSQARIHTYGYGPRIGGSSSMNIHDFAVDLLFKMKLEYIQTNEAIGKVRRQLFSLDEARSRLKSHYTLQISHDKALIVLTASSNLSSSLRIR